jgi:hypothetical protein
LSGSPAIDAGNNAYATGWDQRGPGYPRIVNGIIDIGAFEYQGAGSGPSASRPGPTNLPVLTALTSFMPLGMDRSALPAPALSASPPSTRGATDRLTPTTEVPTGATVASVDRWFAMFKEKWATMTVRWDGLKPTAVVGWLADLLADDASRFR